MPCGEWYELLERYRSATKIYSKAADRLGGSDFHAAWQSTEAALKTCRTARATLLDHEHDHACTFDEWQAEELVLGDQGQSGG